MSSLPTACVIGAGSSGIAAVKALAGHGYDVDGLREVRPRRRQLGVGQHERDVLRLPLAAHQHLARAHGVLGLPDAEVLSRLPAPHAHRAVLRRLRRPLRRPRPHPLRDRRRARRAAAPTASGRSRSTTARRTATTRCWSPTATTGTRAGPSPRSPAPTTSRACRSTRTTTRATTPTSSATRPSSCSGWATRRWTSRSRRASSPSHTYLAARRGAHVIPKYLFGKPIDQIGGSPKIPFAVRRRVLEGMLKVSLGDMERYGLPKPDHRFGDAHPTVSDDILSRMAHGTITAKPNIASLTPRRRALHRRLRGQGRRRRLLHRLQGHVPVLRRGLHRRARQRPAAVPPHVPPRHPERVLHRAAAAARGDHADRRARSPSGSATTSPGRYALPPPARAAGRHRGRAARGCSSATSRPSATRCRSTSTTTSWRLAKERRAGAERARAQGNRLPVRAARSRAGRGVSGAVAARPPRGARRPPTAPRSSPRGATCSPSSATARRACATSCAARSSRRARSTTTSPTRSRCSARSCTRSARRRGAACAPPAGRRRRRGVRRGRLPRLLLLHRRGRGAGGVPDAATRARSARCSRSPRRPAGIDELAADLRAAIAAGLLPDLDVELCAAAMVAVALELGQRLIEREPPDVEGATRFATQLFLAGVVRAPR